MKYPNIKAAHLTHAQIAKAFGYANVNSFRTSSAHQRHMKGVETILGVAFNLNDFRVKRIKQAMAMVEAVRLISDSLKMQSNNHNNS